MGPLLPSASAPPEAQAIRRQELPTPPESQALAAKPLWQRQQQQAAGPRGQLRASLRKRQRPLRKLSAAGSSSSSLSPRNSSSNHSSSSNNSSGSSQMIATLLQLPSLEAGRRRWGRQRLLLRMRLLGRWRRWLEDSFPPSGAAPCFLRCGAASGFNASPAAVLALCCSHFKCNI